MKTSSPTDLVFLPLGGVGEIGMNMSLYGYGQPGQRSWVMIDCGVTFGNVEQTPGVDLVFPDISFIQEQRDKLKAIVITHAHEDHYGALIDLWPVLRVPVYMTAFAAGLLAAKLRSAKDAPVIDVRVISQRARIDLEPFELELIPVSHSIAEPCAVAIRTPLGMTLHTGDWKIDDQPGIGEPIDLDRFHELGDEGVLALVADSTNVVRAGKSPSEQEVAESIEKIIAESPHRVAVTTFASQIARIRGVVLAAAACDREVVVLGRAMHRTIDVATGLGLMKGLPPFRDTEAFGYLPRERVVALMTGSQGEDRAALAKIARDDYRDVAFSPGDRVIFSSRTIPGNERGVNTIINALCDRGIDVITDNDALVHVSGHPRRDEMERLYKLIRPAAVVPVHGEALHLTTHAAFARDMGISNVVRARNGSMVRLAPDDVEIVDHIPTGRLYKDGHLLLDPDESGVAERRKLSFAGAIFVVILMDDSGIPLGECEVDAMGLPEFDGEGESMIDVVGEAVDGAVRSIPRSRRCNDELVAKAGQRAARAAALRAWGKKPLCRCIVIRG